MHKNEPTKNKKLAMKVRKQPQFKKWLSFAQRTAFVLISRTRPHTRVRLETHGPFNVGYLQLVKGTSKTIFFISGYIMNSITFFT
jgi:hypothetical protein